jgi:hypothetical protein
LKKSTNGCTTAEAQVSGARSTFGSGASTVAMTPTNMNAAMVA